MNIHDGRKKNPGRDFLLLISNFDVFVSISSFLFFPTHSAAYQYYKWYRLVKKTGIMTAVLLDWGSVEGAFYILKNTSKFQIDNRKSHPGLFFSTIVNIQKL